MESVPPKTYDFGEFRLDAGEQILWRGDSVADVTPKAVEILLILVKNAGRIVSKEEIFTQVWADSFVEEANLTHHIFRLRKVLGNGDGQEFIQTVPKRGYRFVAPVRETGPGERVSNRRGFKTWAIPAMAILAACLIAGFAWYKLAGAKPTAAGSDRPPMSIARITNSGKVGAASISPDGNFIAYIQNYTSGEGMLYVRQVKTNTERKLLEPAERVFGSTAFSPDGAFIYFIAYEKNDPEGALYRIPVIGGDAARVINSVRLRFTLSPDGQRALFYRQDKAAEKRNIVSAALDGSGDEQIILSVDEGTATGVPVFSPDGRSIVFGWSDKGPGVDLSAPHCGLFSVDIASGENTPITDQKWSEIGKMNWMPDGSGLVFVGSRPRIGNQIYFLSHPGGEVRQLTRELNTYGNYGLAITADGTTLVADIFETAAQLWSVGSSGDLAAAEQLTSGVSDGSRGLATLADGRIVYIARTGEEYDLWVMSDKNGRREGKPLTSDAASEAGVCTTPDGRYIIFGSDRAGNHHLFRIGSDGSGLTQLTFGDTYDTSPDCSPDGSSVIYAVHITGGGIWQVPVEGGTPVQLSDLGASAPSFSPDGKSIAAILPSDSVVKNATLVIIPTESGPPEKTFDVIPYGWYYRPARWTPEGKALLFSKMDNQTGNLWKQSVSGGDPKLITSFKSESIADFTYSKDGGRLIISRGQRGTNVVMLKNFR